ncbi:molybdopterin-guanine dinucleotide biosynthesis protein B [Natrialbaceae archaeon GCM10025810]|uniref:molybdopterin-guanine dinucleotide biosynthesis protein B n=1 Tax=Halovalidus salilacus TaxID=3075124 RepID=UPI0036061C1C
MIPTPSPPHPPRVVAVAGPSDAGKTTLVERLVPRLAETGRVGTIKPIHHEIEIDAPGTDTHRHRTAGADAVVGVTPTLTFDIEETGKRDPRSTGAAERAFGIERDHGDRRELEALANALARLERRKFDYVIVEGFAAAPLPTILVGDRSPDAIGGEVVGRGADDLEELLETIRGLEPIQSVRSKSATDGDEPSA